MDKIVFCPKCKSTNVSKKLTATLVLGAPQQWDCNDCGFESYVFPTAEKAELNKKQN